MIELRNVSKTYRPKKGVPVQALKNVSVTFPDRGMYFILGRSGSGKTTALYLLGGLDACTEGDLLVDGKSTKHFSQKDWDAYRNREVGFVFQDYNLFERFNVVQNVSLASELQGEKRDDGRVAQVLRAVGMEGCEKRAPKELSGGQQQRVAVARALIKDPSVLLADEPTGALDEKTGEELFGLLKELSKQKLVIVVSHDRDFAEKYGDGILEFADGEVIRDTVSNAAPNERRDQDGEAAKRTVRSKRRGLGIASRLRLSAKGLVQHPVRMVVTIFLAMICFALAAFTNSVSSYDRDEVILRSMREAGVSYIGFGINTSIVSDNSGGSPYEWGRWTLQDEANFIERTGAERIDYALSDLQDEYASPEEVFFTGGLPLKEGMMALYGLRLLGGRLPEIVSGDAPQEVAISEFIFRKFVEQGYEEYAYRTDLPYGDGTGYALTGRVLPVSGYDDLLGQVLLIGGHCYTVVGILDTGYNFERYGDLDENDPMSEELHKESITGELLQLHRIAFLCGDYEDLLSFGLEHFASFQSWRSMTGTMDGNQNDWVSLDGVGSHPAEDLTIWYRDGARELGESDVLLPLSVLSEFDDRQTLNEIRTRYIREFAEEHAAQTDLNTEAYIDYIISTEFGENNYHPGYNFAYFDRLALLELAQDETVFDRFETITLDLAGYVFEDMNIVGYYDNTQLPAREEWPAVVLCQEELVLYMDGLSGTEQYSMLFVPLTGDDARDARLLNDMILMAVDGVSYTTLSFTGDRQLISGNVQITSVQHSHNLLRTFANLFVWVSVGFAVFACVMFFNYIHASITGRRREIGIFRSMGASKKDVFLLFFGESILIALLSAVFAIVLFAAAVAGFNFYMQTALLLPITILSVQAVQIVLIVGLSAAVALLATFLPCYINSRKKPIDVIRSAF